jgi:putative heme degradation protein
VTEDIHPDVAETLGGTKGAAIALHQFFQELIEAGFSREEALALVNQQLAIASAQNMVEGLMQP